MTHHHMAVVILCRLYSKTPAEYLNYITSSMQSMSHRSSHHWNYTAWFIQKCK